MSLICAGNRFTGTVCILELPKRVSQVRGKDWEAEKSPFYRPQIPKNTAVFRFQETAVIPVGSVLEKSV